MTTVIECRPLAAGRPAPDLEALKAKQALSFLEAMGLAEGCADFAVVGATILKIAPSELH